MAETDAPALADRVRSEQLPRPQAAAAGPAPSRRQFLGTVGLAVGAGGLLLAGCGSGPARPAPAGGRPRRGGTLRLGTTGGGSSENIDGDAGGLNPDFARDAQLYEALLEVDANNVPTLALAEEVSPNADASMWTIRVRKGIEFHNGKELTIDDVIFTFNRIVHNRLPAASSFSFVNLGGIRKLDRYTMSLPMHAPYSILRWVLTGDGGVSIVPVGYDPKKPVGTGAFKYKSFTPGVESVFTRNDNYWRSGEPYFDAVVITDYANETAQVNALLAGEIDCADQLSAASIRTVTAGGKQARVWTGPGWVPITMNLDVAPFNDVRVRQAMRLIVDRPQMRELVYGGHGYLGNDIFGRTDPEYDTSIPQRHQDIAQARYLLKKAGHENLTTTLVTGPIKAGAVEMAQVFAQQAKSAGVTVNLDNITITAFYGPNYLKWPFSQDWWNGSPYLVQASYSMVPTAPWDETHWASSSYGPRYYSLFTQALRTVAEDRQAAIVHEMMQMDWNDGGYVIPMFNPVIVGQSSRLQGVAAQQRTASPWIQWQFRSLWFG
jgi:peptide/nickel transport system substrate-binding protein